MFRYRNISKRPGALIIKVVLTLIMVLCLFVCASNSWINRVALVSTSATEVEMNATEIQRIKSPYIEIYDFDGVEQSPVTGICLYIDAGNSYTFVIRVINPTSSSVVKNISVPAVSDGFSVTLSISQVSVPAQSHTDVNCTVNNNGSSGYCSVTSFRFGS